jgi:CCR4-NOT complex subunit CAF16
MGADAVAVSGLDFAYADGPPVLRGLALTLPAGVRCLLVGGNGTGKTTLLSLLAGRHMMAPQVIRVLGRPAFYDTSLVERVAFLGGSFPFDVDLGVEEILAARPCDAGRASRHLSLLGVDPRWRMNRVSDGQRRRVQILLALLHPAEVLLLDEVTTDLDVIARADLLSFLREESELRGATILYATHILEGLEGWATHLAHLCAGRIRVLAPLADLPELATLARAGVPSPLLKLVDGWLRTHG